MRGYKTWQGCQESNSDLQVMNYPIDNLTANKSPVGEHDFICLQSPTQNNSSLTPPVMRDRRYATKQGPDRI